MRNEISVKRNGSKPMSCADAISEARHWSNYLLEREFRGPGDTIEAASYRVETKWGVPATLTDRLRIRDVTDMLLSNWCLLRVAYDNCVSQEEKRLAHEVELAKAVGLNAASTTSLRAALALLKKEKP